MKQKFIRTTDKFTATVLLKNGFKKLNEGNGIYIFLNDNNLLFSSDLDKTKIQYTSILCI